MAHFSPTIQKKLIALFKKNTRIKLAYLFGSRAKKTAGPLSDYDLAVYADTFDSHELSELRLELLASVSRVLKTDAVDIVMLNTLEQPELKYAIIKEGALLYERPLFKMLVEPRIVTEYCDFRMLLKKNGLTRDL